MQKLISRVNKPRPLSWFLTQTISPKLYINPASYQFAVTLKPFITILDKYCYDYSYTTELTDQGNVHYHAWILFKNDNRKYMFINDIKKNKQLGFCMINKKPIEECDRVYEYMIDKNNEKKGKNLQAAYNVINRIEITGSHTNTIQFPENGDFDTNLNIQEIVLDI